MGRAYTYGVGEEDDPVVADEFVEVDLAAGGLSIEVRGDRAQTETVQATWSVIDFSRDEGRQDDILTGQRAVPEPLWIVCGRNWVSGL